MLKETYAIWNNKGGVGKSTLTFHLASRYAELHEDKNVLVIDMCPQANSSMLLLGGGAEGEDSVLALCLKKPLARTIVGYLSNIYSSMVAGTKLRKASSFILNVAEYNDAMPDNLFLLCGDGNLEQIVPALNRAVDFPGLEPGASPWTYVHKSMSRFAESVASDFKDKDLVVIFDTNPSFSIYTELAIASAKKLIVPVNADDSSRVATKAMFSLLHGSRPPHPIYGRWTFAKLAGENKLAIPKVHLIVGNRLTQYAGAAEAFAGMSEETANTMFGEYKTNPTWFTPRSATINTIKKFRSEYLVPLRDFNTAGVVSAHIGCPLSQLSTGQYDVYNHQVQVSARYIRDCLEAVDAVTAAL